MLQALTNGLGFWIYELDTGAFKTCFTAGEITWESVIIRYDGAIRWLYAIDKSANVYRVNITTTPTLYSTVSPSDYYPVNAYTQMTFDGNYFYVSQKGDSFYKGFQHRNVFAVFDVNFNKIGDLVFPIEATGTLGEDTDSIPKSQGTAFHKGNFVFACGKIYKPGDDVNQESRFQGLKYNNS